MGNKEKLFAAIARNDPKAVRDSLAPSLFGLFPAADVNVADENGDTPLILASKLLSADIIRLLLDKGARVDARDRDQRTPLFHACNNYQKEQKCGALLLGSGADANARDKDGSTPLIFVAGNSDSERPLFFLIGNGAEVNARNLGGRTALIAASEYGRKGAVTLLLESAADIDAADEAGCTATMLAARHGERETVEILLDGGADVNAKDKNGHTPLMHAAFSGKKEVVYSLLSRGADVNAATKGGSTALSLASQFGHPETVEILSARGRSGGAVEKAPVPLAPESPRPSLGDRLAAGLVFLDSTEFKQEVERAKVARDAADRERWVADGSPGLGATHACAICGCGSFGEETVLRLQDEALRRGDRAEAQRIEQQSGYRCKSCGREYCKQCLEREAPPSLSGGRACLRCGGGFEVLHG